ncbi:MAG: alanine racemase [Actinomycetota bacterium]|nr:alanine racemase [Actinomycetota bacterium]
MATAKTRREGMRHPGMAIPPEITTPEVMIDVDILRRNIDRMADVAQARGLQLRPHAKTHKVLEIAELQLAGGAVGLTVATIGEAEVFARAGVADIFIAYPLWVTAPQAARLLKLAEASRVTVGVDSAESASFMGGNLGAGAGRISVLVELDSGHHRSGVRPEDAAAVARAAAAAGLDVAGVFTFPGHSYAPGMPMAAARQEDEALRQGADELAGAGFTVRTISGGSTPTAALGGTASLDSTAVTELRPGVYVFGDAQQFELGRCETADIALTVASTVVSHHRTAAGEPGRFIIDAGSKVLGSDRPAWVSGYGRLLDHPDARITALSEHHATVEWPPGVALPDRGERLRVVPNHVCLTMNLVDDVCLVREGALAGRWQVAARGKNS